MSVSIATKMVLPYKLWTGMLDVITIVTIPLSSHVALVAMLLKESAFNLYRCDRSVSLGVNIESIVKVRSTIYHLTCTSSCRFSRHAGTMIL